MTEKLREPLRTLLLMAVKHSGSYDPIEVLPQVEESMTLFDYQTAEAFLGWCHSTGRKFGHGNLDCVFSEWQG